MATVSQRRCHYNVACSFINCWPFSKLWPSDSKFVTFSCTIQPHLKSVTILACKILGIFWLTAAIRSSCTNLYGIFLVWWLLLLVHYTWADGQLQRLTERRQVQLWAYSNDLTADTQRASLKMWLTSAACNTISCWSYCRYTILCWFNNKPRNVEQVINFCVGNFLLQAIGLLQQFTYFSENTFYQWLFIKTQLHSSAAGHWQ